MNINSAVIQITYFISAILFILGLKRMSSPKTAMSGFYWSGIGMLLSVIVTFLFPELKNFLLIILAIISSTIIAWYSGKIVKITAIPEMIALFNGMGGGAAAAIAAVELIKISKYTLTNTSTHISITTLILGMFGALIGCVSFSGSILALIKLRDILKKTIYFKKQQLINSLVILMTILFGIIFLFTNSIFIFVLFFIFGLFYGVLMTIPIGGADMPVVIALYNAFTGLAVACEGFLMNNIAMIIAGTVVGSAGTLLTLLMAKTMNRSLANILFSRFGVTTNTSDQSKGEIKSIEITDATIALEYANNIIIVPGYGMAVAQAQQKIWELAQLLLSKNVNVKFAVHPLAGRMPGHMNVLLAEAGVPYDYIADIDEINEDFINTDVVVVLGANDVVNPEARTNKSSPIYGMPILNVDYAKQCFVIKRGKGAGYSGVQNSLFYANKTCMVYGDAKDVITKIIHCLKS